MSERGGWSERGQAYAQSVPHRDGPSLPKLMALARPGRGDRCLDIGTGAGHTAARLAAVAGEVIGLDPSAGMLDAARRTYGHLTNLSFVLAPGDACGLPDAHLDLVTARHTLHHHRDPLATLREIRRVLRPGGRLVIVDEVTPNPRVDGWLDALLRARDPSHVRAYSLTEWRALIARAGLEWVVGDTDTRYTLEIDAWLDRGGADAARGAETRALLEAADPCARRSFRLRRGAAGPTSFEQPMALILAVKPTDAPPEERA